MVTPKDRPMLALRWRVLRDKKGWTPYQIAEKYNTSYNSVLYWLGSSKTISATVEDSRRKSNYYNKYQTNLKNDLPTVFEIDDELSLSEIQYRFVEKYGINPRESTLKKFIIQFIDSNPLFPIEETFSGSGFYRLKK